MVHVTRNQTERRSSVYPDMYVKGTARTIDTRTGETMRVNMERRVNQTFARSTGKALLAVLAVLTMGASSSTWAQQPMAEGEVRRLDMENGKVTIRHGEIKTIDMPPMTMVFTARPKSILQGLKVGDKIRFVAKEENGQYITTAITRKAD